MESRKKEEDNHPGMDKKSDVHNDGNEKGKLTESRDDIPHGQGAHVNEKESNAQEDYPGTQESEKDKRENK